MALFKDLGKAGKDLLSKEFNATEQKVELKSSTSDVTFESSWTSTSQGKVVTNFQLPKSSNLEVEFSGDSNVIATLKHNLSAYNTLFNVKAATNKNYNIGGEYKRKDLSFTTDIELTPSTGPLLHVSTLITRSCCSLGGKVSMFAGEELRVKEYSVGASYFAGAGSDVALTLSENSEKKTAPVGLFQFLHKASPQFSYAARYTRTFEESPKSSSEVGGQYEVNNGLTVGAKLNQSAQLGFFALHKLNPNMSLTQAFSLNVAQTSQPYQYGFALKFKY